MSLELTDQQGDVLLSQSNNDGEIEVRDGLVQMSGGLETSAYLSLFGGNSEDDGARNNPAQWWGNLNETETSNKYTSRAAHLLEGLPAIPANLIRIEKAAIADLEWMVEAGAASSVDVVASMPGRGEIKLTVCIVAAGQPLEFEFFENWSAST